MKKLICIVAIFILICNVGFAQESIFERIGENFTTSKAAIEKIERFKARGLIKNWEIVLLKSNLNIGINFKGIFNLLGTNLEFEITKDFGKKYGIQRYEAELKNGGYALISNSINGIGASIWYRDYFYSIEFVEEGIYFISETDINKIAEDENPNDYITVNNLKKTRSNESRNTILSVATIKVIVIYTAVVAQYYNVDNLVSDCEITTNRAFENSLVSSVIDIVHYQQLTYTESGHDETDIGRFTNNNDGYMDAIHSLRNQYEADACILLVNSLDAQGIAASIGADFSNAFCVVRANAAVSDYSFPHELGHLFGCRHDSDPGTEPYEYAHGFNWFGKLSYNPNPRFYKTIMSIEIPDKYMRVQYFSNPNVHDQLNNPMGSNNYCYCASAIDDYASTLAALEPHYTTSGEMPASEWWSGSITLVDNVIVPSGVSLTINPGASVNFNGKYILINGTLSGGNNIACAYLKQGSTLKAIGSINSMANLASSGQTVELQARTYTENISFTGKTSLTIKGQGVSVSNIQGNITAASSNYLTIQDLTCKGVVVNGCTQPLMTNNINPAGGYTYGLAEYNCTSGRFKGNIINAYTGFGAFGGSYGVLARSYLVTSINNGGYGLSASNNANITITPIEQGVENGIIEVCGNYYYELSATGGAYIAALNCKFPGGSPRIVGNVFVSNPLNCSAMKYNAPNDVTSDLYKEEKLENTEAEESKSPEEDYKSISKIYFDLLQKIDSDLSAIGYFDKNKFYGEYINVIDNFKGFINKYPSSFLSATAITTIFHSFKQLEEYEAMKTFLDGIINDNKLSKFSSLAKRFIIDYYSIRKNYISAVTTADEILNITSVDTNLICDVLYQKGLIYSHDMNNTTAAVESFSKIIKNYPDNLLVYFAKNELSILGYNLEESQEKSQVAEPLKFTMSNYPNPFNPVTTINYSLPNNEKVVIKVYDILGREIAELVNEVKTAGRYSVKFDGAELSSGIYFYSITAGDYRQVKKIVLTK